MIKKIINWTPSSWKDGMHTWEAHKVETENITMKKHLRKEKEYRG